MKEETPGLCRTSRSGRMPEDIEIAHETGSWRLYISKKEQSLIIDTTDYHPGLLFVTREDLKRLLERFDD
jgi:hypothetical protein